MPLQERLTMTRDVSVKQMRFPVRVEGGLNFYLKDPESTQVGRNLIAGSIELMNELGFDEFTFKKLGAKIGSPECTVYRYFENKQKLLLYLMNWYWTWMRYKIMLATANINSYEEQLKAALTAIIKREENIGTNGYVNIRSLYNIVTAESVKVYYMRSADEEYRNGCFIAYQEIVSDVAGIILKINPGFDFPRSLASTLLQGINHQRYLMQHLPSVSDIKKDDKDLLRFFTQLAMDIIKS